MLFGSKESFISLNNILLMTAIFSVFLGVLYPLIYEAILGSKISVGPPFYNTIFAPMVLIAGLFIGSSIDSQWQRPFRSGKLLKLAYCLVLIAIILAFLYFFLGISFSAIEGMSFIAGSFILITYTLSIFNSDRKRRIANIGSFVSHLGFGLLLIGIPLNSNLSYEETVAVVINVVVVVEQMVLLIRLLLLLIVRAVVGDVVVADTYDVYGGSCVLHVSLSLMLLWLLMRVLLRRLVLMMRSMLCCYSGWWLLC